MTEDPRMSQVEAFGRFVTGQRRLAQRRLREPSARYAQPQVPIPTRESKQPLVQAMRLWPPAVERMADRVAPAFPVRGVMMRHGLTERLSVASRPALDKKA